MRIHYTYKPIFIFLFLFTIFAFGSVVIKAQPLETNETTVNLKNKGIGLVVKVNPLEPTVGTVLVTVSPTDIAKEEPIKHAIVMIRMEDQTKEELYKSYALNTPQNLLDYKTNFLLKKPGTWTIFITIRNKDETLVNFDMEIEVKDRNIVGTKVGTIVWIVVSLILFSGASYIAFRIRDSTAKLT